MKKSNRRGVLRGSTSQRRELARRLSGQQNRLRLETLEARNLLSATFGIETDQTLDVSGATTGDAELVSHSEGLCRPRFVAVMGPAPEAGAAVESGSDAGIVEPLSSAGHDEPGHEEEGDDHPVYPAEPAELWADDQAYWRAWEAARKGGDSGEFGRMNDGGTYAPGFGSLTLADTFSLHSKPDATKTIFLDFDGFTVEGTSWNNAFNGGNPITHPAYDPAGNGAAFTDSELARIQEAWHRVAEDYAPFDVNVTTEDPGEAALVNTGGSDDEWGIRVVITVDDFASCGCGGFAYINSFRWGYQSADATDTPVYVFNQGSLAVAAAASHEVGHALGLSHDGTTADHPSQPNAAYYNGHGTGENAWGPIMGSGYYRNLSTWDQGEYYGANNGGGGANYGRGPDDLQIMTSFFGFGYREDMHGDSPDFATEVEYLGPNASNSDLDDVAMFGVISDRNDVDYIRFVTGGGVINLDIQSTVSQVWLPDGLGGYEPVVVDTGDLGGEFGSVNTQYTNLDISAELYDSSGTLVASSNDDPGVDASFTDLTVDAGVYYIRIDGVNFGNPSDSSGPTGYTDYASLGQYMITGTVIGVGGPIANAVADDIFLKTEEDVLLTVSYADRDGVDVSTIGTGDIRVLGPGGYDQVATFVSIDDNSNGSPRVVTYSVSGPGGVWDSLASGTYSVRLEAGEVLDTGGTPSEETIVGTFDVDVAPTLGPDGYSYTADPVAYNFIDISETGTLVLDGEDDDTFEIVPGNGFSFDFYGGTYESMFVSSNGLVTFDSPNPFYGNTDLTDAPAEPSIAVLWDDLAAAADGGVYWQLLGSGDEQQLVLQWQTRYFGANGDISFQAVFDETDMSITTTYRDLDGNSGTNNEANSATIGIKDAGTQGDFRLLASYNTLDNGYVQTGRAVKFVVTNQAPTDIILDTPYVNENSGAGTVVGTLTAADPNFDEMHTFELVAGAGDTDNSRFAIVGDQLQLTETVDFETQSEHSIRVRVTDIEGAFYETDMLISVLNLAEIESIVIGDGTDTRSRVDQVVVTFDSEVTLGAAAFQLQQRGGGGLVATDVATDLVGGKTVATLTFSGALTESGSLADGNYQLTIFGDQITDVLGNGLDGDRDGTLGGNASLGESEADAFYRLFGDTNGDRTVDFTDLTQMLLAYDSPSDYRSDLDFDANGSIGFEDLVQMLSRYDTSLDFE